MAMRPLRYVLIRLVALITILPLALTTLFGCVWLLPQARSDLHRLQQQLATAVATQVENYLTTSHAILEASANLHVNDLDERNNLHQLQHLLESNVKSQQHLRAIYLVDPNGRIKTIATAQVAQQRTDLIGFDPLKTRWWSTPLKHIPSNGRIPSFRWLAEGCRWPLQCLPETVSWLAKSNWKV